MNTSMLTRVGKHFVASLLLVLCSALVFSACAEEEPEVIEEEPIGEEPIGEEPIEERPGIMELEGDPMEFVGQMVTVDGEVAEVYGPGTFMITGGLFTGEVPVIVPPNVTTGVLTEGDDVQVTGTVRAYVLTEIETEYGLDLQPEVEAEIEENEPVIIAETVMPLMDEGLQE